MGMGKTVVASAYLVAEVDKTLVTRETLGCPICCQSRSGKHCVYCGEKNTTIMLETSRHPEEWDILPEDEWIDLLYCPAFDLGRWLVFLPNVGGQDSSIEIPEIGHIAIANDAADRCKQAFEAEYSEVMEVIRSRVKSLRLEFGIVSYWS